MTSTISIHGFTVTYAHAWLVTCDRCGDCHMVYDNMAEVDAELWALEHCRTAHIDKRKRGVRR
jgi:hypothetical protein